MYEQLRTSGYVPLEDESIFAKCSVGLGDVLIQDEFVKRYWGTALADYQFLCQTICGDFPDGMVILNTDSERALVLSPSVYYEPQYFGFNDAMHYFRSGGAIGLVVSSQKSRRDRINCEIFEVLEDEDFDAASTIEYLVSAVRKWEAK